MMMALFDDTRRSDDQTLLHHRLMSLMRWRCELDNQQK